MDEELTDDELADRYLCIFANPDADWNYGVVKVSGRLSPDGWLEEIDYSEDPSVLHEDCWEEGMPPEYHFSTRVEALAALVVLMTRQAIQLQAAGIDLSEHTEELRMRAHSAVRHLWTFYSHEKEQVLRAFGLKCYPIEKRSAYECLDLLRTTIECSGVLPESEGMQATFESNSRASG